MCTISKPSCFQHFELDKLTKYSYSPCQQPVALPVQSAARFRPIRDSCHIQYTINRGRERGRRESIRHKLSGRKRGRVDKRAKDAGMEAMGQGASGFLGLTVSGAGKAIRLINQDAHN